MLHSTCTLTRTGSLQMNDSSEKYGKVCQIYWNHRYYRFGEPNLFVLRDAEEMNNLKSWLQMCHQMRWLCV
jgi:hypothetical protein